MGHIHEPEPVTPLLAAFSRYPAALAWARERAEAAWGATALVSEPFAFTDTDYYEPSMGPGLRKQFFAFAESVDPASLIEHKRATNAWEEEYARASQHDEARPLNLDPGYLMLGKLVLASTKDHLHRLYLGQGIYAEVTLHFKHGQWRHFEWTFPDYRRADYQAFFDECRQWHRQQRKERAR
ncbi:MAG: DUF4416 family protein [Planctomycetales bacterium]|nr:DUF4416 family protein [Planctomycetales bacterium]